MTSIYDGDKFTGLRPWSDEPCRWCDDGSPTAGPMPNTIGCVHACASCIMAFEEDDAPEELAITLGDMSVDDYPEETDPSMWDPY